MRYLNNLITPALLAIVLSGCSLFETKKEIVYIKQVEYRIAEPDPELLEQEELPQGKEWSSEDKQGADVGLYIVDLHSAAERANLKIKQIKEFLEKVKLEQEQKANGNNNQSENTP